MFRKILIVIAFVFLIMAVVMIFIAAWLSTPTGERFIKSEIEKRVTDLLNQNVTIGSFETNIFNRFVFTDITITHDLEVPGGQFISGKYARVTYNPLHLLKAELAIDEIVLKEFNVHVSQDSTVYENIPGMNSNKSGNTTSSSLFTLFVRSVDITDLSIEYAYTTYSFNGVLDGVDLSVNHSNDDGYSFSITTSILECNYQNKNVRIENIDMEGNFENGLLTISSFLTENPGLKITGEAIIPVSITSRTSESTVAVSGNIDGLYRVAEDFLPAFLSNASGDFTVTVELTKPSDNIRLAASVKIDSLRIRDWNLPHAAIRASYDHKTVSLDSIEAHFADGAISGHGMMDADQEYQLHFSAEQINLEKILVASTGKQIGLSSDLSGTFVLSGVIPGGLFDSIQANVQAAGTVYRETELPDTELSLSYEKEKIHVDATFNENRMTAEGAVSVDSLDINVDGRFASLYTLAAILGKDITGKGTAECKISGPLKNPDISCMVNAENVHYGKVPINHLTGGFYFNENGFRLNDVHLSASDVPVDSVFNAFDVEGFNGSAAYDLNASGKFDNLQGNARIMFKRPAYKDIAFQNGSVEASFNNGKIMFDNVALTHNSMRVSGEGIYTFSESTGDAALDFERVYSDTLSDSPDTAEWQDSGKLSVHFDASESTDNPSVTVKGDSLEVNQFAILIHEENPVRGILDFTLDFNGRFDQPHGQLNISMDNLAWKEVVLNSIDTSIAIKPDSLWISSVKIESDKAEMHGNAGISIQSDGGFFSNNDSIEGRLAGTVFDLGLFNSLLPGTVNLSGKGRYDISWNGTMNDPSYAASFHISDGTFSSSENGESVQDITVDINSRDDSLYVDTFSGVIQGVPVAVSGYISMERINKASLNLKSLVAGKKAVDLAGIISPDSLDVKLEMNAFNLAALQPFVPQLINLDGIATSTMAVKGSFASPVINGDASLNDVSFKTVFFNRPVTDGVFNFSFDNRTVTVDTLYLKSKDGNIEGNGYLVYGGTAFEEIDLAASIRNMKFDQPDKYVFLIDNADVAYTKADDGRYELSGAVIIDTGTIDYNLKPQSLLFKNDTSNGEKNKKRSPLVTDTTLNIRLSNKNPVLVDNNIAHASLNTQIDIIGTLDKPNLTGRVSAEDGYVLYLDRKFEIARGTMDFINPSGINPIIDFQASANIQQTETFAGETYVIMLNVDGPLDEAAIVLNSSPALSKAEILSLLTFGATTDQLTGKETVDQKTATSSIMMERVTELSSRVATKYLSKKISSLLGIKGLNISGSIFSGRQENQIDAAEKIDRQMKSEYVTNVGEGNNRGIRLRYDLSRFFSIEGYTNQTGQSGIDLEYSVTIE